MRKLIVELPDDMRLGQAIIVALKKSGDLTQEVWESPSDPMAPLEIEYKVTGIDLFYMEDKELQKRIKK